MMRFGVGWLIGLVCGLMLTLGGLVVIDVVLDHQPLKVTAERCQPGAKESEGLCVRRAVRGSGIFNGPEDQIHIFHYRDGKEIPRFTYLETPFHGADNELEVEFSESGIVIRGEDGEQLVLPESFYALD